MEHASGVMTSHPMSPEIDLALILRCADACSDTARACITCADACLAEASRDELIRCIRLNLDCSDICQTSGRLLARLTETDLTLPRAQLQVCVLASRECRSECEAHASQYEHCRVAAEACRASEAACNAVLAATLQTPFSTIDVDETSRESFPASDAPAVNGAISATKTTEE